METKTQLDDLAPTNDQGGGASTQDGGTVHEMILEHCIKQISQDACNAIHTTPVQVLVESACRQAIKAFCRLEPTESMIIAGQTACADMPLKSILLAQRVYRGMMNVATMQLNRRASDQKE